MPTLEVPFRDETDAVGSVLNDGERAKPIPGYDRDYWITTEYRVISLKSGSPEIVEPLQREEQGDQVKLCRNGVNWVQINTLYQRAFEPDQPYPDRKLAIDLHEDYGKGPAEIAAILDGPTVQQVRYWLEAWKNSGGTRPDWQK